MAEDGNPREPESLEEAVRDAMGAASELFLDWPQHDIRQEVSRAMSAELCAWIRRNPHLPSPQEVVSH